MSEPDDINPRRELLRRYADIFREAWRDRRKNAPSRRYTSIEADFLPASLSVSERPTPIMPHVALWLMCALFLIAIAWSLIGKMDVVVVAAGKVLSNGKTKAIQTVEPQIVRRLHVQEGQSVSEGDLLVEFDPTSAEADFQRFTADRDRAEALIWIYSTLLANIGDKAASKPIKIDKPAPAMTTDFANAALRARWEEYRAKVDRAAADLSRRRAERAVIESTLGALRVRITHQLRIESDYRAMYAAKATPRHALTEQEVKTVDLQNESEKALGQKQQMDLAIAEAEATLVLTYASDKALWRERLSDAEREHTSALAERTKAQYRMTTNVIRAPVSGRVQQLAVTAPGAVATSGQPIMQLVPEGEADEVEAMVENRDIGFLRIGQTAAIKLEAFDYTRYGTLPAKLMLISTDSVADERGVLRYPVRFRLERTTLEIAGKPIPVTPGMVAYADVLSGRRSIFSYFLSPVLKTVQESLRER
jgi:hemolysin D